MAPIDPSLNLQQQTALRQRLTPAQVMFGQYLEMNAPELEDELRRALDENPALELAEHERDVCEHDSRDDEGELFDETAEQLQRADYGDDDDVPYYRLQANNRSADDNVYDPVAVDDRLTMADVLLQQLGDYNLSDLDRTIAAYIIGSIDDNGYLTRGYAAIADDMAIATGMDIAAADVRRVAATIRSMDPAGVGAVDLRDCLLLQLQRLTPPNADAELVVRDYFDLFSKRQLDRLQQRSGLKPDRLHAALETIRRLNPKPGALVDSVAAEDRLRYIVPDFHVDIEADGRASITLGGNIPDLSIAQSFQLDTDPQDATTPAGRRATHRAAGSDETSGHTTSARAFIKTRHDEAAMLIRLLSARAQTLMQVMQVIVGIQRRFFETGNPADLRPMVLRDIGDATGLDLSVISRATAGKYVSTSLGVWPVKMLFNEARTDDPETSVHEITQALEVLIRDEDKRHPLADEALKDLLVEQGYDIARRTVAKYREQLGYPPARLRRGL